MKVSLVFWLVALVLAGFFVILWFLLPIVVKSTDKEINFPQIATDIGVCLGCISPFAWALYSRFHHVVSLDAELVAFADFVFVHLCSVCLVAWVNGDKGFLAPLSIAAFCLYSVGEDGFVGEMIVPFLACSGTARAFCRLAFSTFKYANLVNLFVFALEVTGFVLAFSFYMWHLPKGSRTIWDTEILCGLLLVPWFYTGKMKTINPAFRALDKSVTMLEDIPVWLSISDIKRVHSVIMDNVALAQLEDLPPPPDSPRGSDSDDD